MSGEVRTDPRLTTFLESFFRAAGVAIGRRLVSRPSQLFGDYLTKYGYEAAAVRAQRSPRVRVVDTTPLAEKRCPRCGRVLPASAFRADPRKPHGLTSYCKTCTRDYDREYRRRKREAGLSACSD